ncbi:DNA polymerase III subunit beta [Dehalococcoidia bacterium]|nr:DNA polymerase III subunit beta [Dehalococcoidia bacterium]
MRLTCLKENLSKALTIVGRAVATRTTLPVTQNVLLSTDQGRLKLTATNLEIAISTWIGGKVDNDGAITVPARLLTDFVNSLPDGQIEISMTPKPLGIQLTSGRFDGRVLGTDAEEFPPIPSVEEGVGVSISPKVLRSAINQVVFAAATEDSRPVLTGVKMELEGDRLTIAAADGFRLAIRTGSLASPVAESVSFIIPARTLSELYRLLADEEEPVEFTVTPQRSQAMFRLKNIELVSQLVQGNFPDYQQLIPQSHSTRTVVTLEDFIQAARTAAIFARDGSGVVRIQIIPGSSDSSGKMVISARADEVGDNIGEIDAKVEGEEAKIAFNGKYLSDVLGVINEGQVALETTTPSSPGVLRAVGDEEYTHVIMPMFVQWE